jgi:hypothetical protein
MARRIEGVTPNGALHLLKYARRKTMPEEAKHIERSIFPEQLARAERAEAEGAIGAA